MQVLVQVHYIYNDIKVLRRGYMKIHPRKYREDPDKSAAGISIKWIDQIRKESPGMEIHKVFYDGVDITTLVKKE